MCGVALRCALFLIVFAQGAWIAPAYAQDEPSNKKEEIQQQAESTIEALEKPLYNPFVERYVLDEIKQLRKEMADNRLELTQQILDRDLMVSDKAMNYATNTVTYFFYLIAAVSSVLVIVGWTSIRDLRSIADKEVQKLVETYESRLRAIEKQLTQKTAHIDENRQAIEQTQEVHSLWLRAAQEHSDHNKIAVYDEILRLRPYDSEAMTYKADSALEIGEAQWAKNLCMQVIEREPEYGHAHFQLACANVALGYYEEAVQGLSKALNFSPNITEDIRNDSALAELHGHPAFINLLKEHKITLDPKASGDSHS